MNSIKSGCCFQQNDEICKLRVVKLIGFCKYCENYYCNKHRLPETHKCEKLDIIKNNQRIILETRLKNERSIGSKIQQI
jgi:predicted nucleic acid binding AN1-type Zn finger protein